MSNLRNKTIGITRNKQDAREFFQLVNAEGGKALAIPVIEVVPADQKAGEQFMKLLQMKKHDYCTFMSVRAVRVLFDLVGDAAVALKQTSVIAVGPKTRQELGKYGVEVDIMPKKFSSIGLVDLLSKREAKGKKMIIPRSGEANDFVAKSLSDHGMEIDEVFLYRTRTSGMSSEWKEFCDLLEKKKIDAIVFTSASNVRSFFEKMKKIRKKIPREVRVISIGPFTTAELARKDVKCHEADEHTIRGTIETAKELFKDRV